MQLLTATKLSTVAMLVMASVVYFQSVSAVPVEHQDVAAAQAGQPAAEMMHVPDVPVEQSSVEMTDVVEVAPVDISAYESPEPGKPSEQAYKDLFAIYSVAVPELVATASQPVDLEQPFTTLPPEMLFKITEHMDVNSLKNFAQTDRRNLLAAHDQLPRLGKKLISKMDTLWNEYMKEVEEQEQDEDGRGTLIAASSVWESTLKEMTGQEKLKDCSYGLLPYTTDKRTQKTILTDQELLGILRNDEKQFKAHMRHNICRLAVNGGYPWLMRIITMHGFLSTGEVFTILAQLRLFSPDAAFVSDLDKLLKLFAAITKIDAYEFGVSENFKLPLMLFAPVVIPALNHVSYDITPAALFFMAIKQQQSNPDAHLDLDGINLPESIKRGEVKEFIDNIKSELVDHDPFENYSRKSLQSLVLFDKDLGGTKRQTMNDLLDHASKGFEKQGNKIQASRPLSAVKKRLNPLEVLVNLLSEEEFIKLYDEVFESDKDPLSVVFVGRSRHGTRVMEHAFEKVFGPAGAPISDDLEVDVGIPTYSEHLTQLVMICAISCTDENREAFFKLLAKKIQDTPQLPGDVDQNSSPSVTVAQQVAYEVAEQVKAINMELKEQESNTPEDNRQSIQKEVNQVITQLKTFAGELNQVPESAALAENSSVSLQSLSE